MGTRNLEDEMDRFEAEISEVLPPPPSDQFVIRPPDGSVHIPPPPNIMPPQQPGFMAPPMPPRMPPPGAMMPPIGGPTNMIMSRGPMPPPMPQPIAMAPIAPPMPAPPMPLPVVAPPMMPPMNTGSGNVRFVSGDNQSDLSNLLGGSSDGPSTSGEGSKKKKDKDKKKTVVRVAGGTVWEDDSLLDWDPNDFRLFVGDIGNEVSDDALMRHFNHYPSLLRARVVRDKRTKKTKGFGFISFKDPQDYLKAMREMNGKYIGNRPIKLRKSNWKDRNIAVARKREKEKKKLGLK